MLEAQRIPDDELPDPDMEEEWVRDDPTDDPDPVILPEDPDLQQEP